MKQLDGTLVFVMLDKPRKCWDEDKGQEWKAGIVLTDEDVVDAYDELYPKQAAKKVKAAEFESIYHCPVPEGAGKNVWVITLKKNTKLSNGEPVPDKYKPRVFEEVKGKLIDVTFTKLPANGSKGSISIDHWAGEKGNVARLKNVKVTELIEYVAPEGSQYEPGDEFSNEQPKNVPESARSDKKPAAKKAKPKADEDDDIPF